MSSELEPSGVPISWAGGDITGGGSRSLLLVDIDLRFMLGGDDNGAVVLDMSGELPWDGPWERCAE